MTDIAEIKGHRFAACTGHAQLFILYSTAAVCVCTVHTAVCVCTMHTTVCICTVHTTVCVCTVHTAVCGQKTQLYKRVLAVVYTAAGVSLHLLCVCVLA